MDRRSDSQLPDLRSRVLRFGVEWAEATGRPLATARDGLDFLTAMKSREDFWAALAADGPGATPLLDAAALREALPANAPPQETASEEVLRSLGLAEGEILAVLTGLDDPPGLDDAIRAAFAESTPQKVARALERVLDTDRDVLATEQYVRRLPEAAGVGRSLGVLMGTAVLLVGTTLGACVARCGAPQSAPTPRTSQQTPTTPEAAPNPGAGAQSTPEPTPPEPAPPEPTPPPRPYPPPGPAPAYKGVSPRRRGALHP